MKKIITTAAAGLSSPYEDAERDLDVALVDYSHGDRIGKAMVFSSTEFNEGLENADEDVKELINAGGQGPTLVSVNVTPSTSSQTIRPETGEAFNEVDVEAVTNTIDNNITPENIKKDVTILGITGTLEQTSNLEAELTALNCPTAETVFETQNCDLLEILTTYRGNQSEGPDYAIYWNNEWQYYHQPQYKYEFNYNNDSDNYTLINGMIIFTHNNIDKGLLLNKNLQPHENFYFYFNENNYVTDATLTYIPINLLEKDTYRIKTVFTTETYDGNLMDELTMPIYTDVYKYNNVEIGATPYLKMDSIGSIKSAQHAGDIWDQVKPLTLTVTGAAGLSAYTWYANDTFETIYNMFTASSPITEYPLISGMNGDFNDMMANVAPDRTFDESLWGLSILNSFFTSPVMADIVLNEDSYLYNSLPYMASNGHVTVEKWDETTQTWVAVTNPYIQP